MKNSRYRNMCITQIRIIAISTEKNDEKELLEELLSAYEKADYQAIKRIAKKFLEIADITEKERDVIRGVFNDTFRGAYCTKK